MKEQLLKDIKVGFDSLNAKLSEMLSLLKDKPTITIKTPLTRKKAGFRMAIRIKEFYVFKHPHKIIGLRLDGTPCCIRPDDPNPIVIAEFFDTRNRGFFNEYTLDELQNLDTWTKRFIQIVGDSLISIYDSSLINVEYER